MGYPYNDGPREVEERNFVCSKCGHKFEATSTQYWHTTADDVKSYPGAIAKIKCGKCGEMAYSYPQKRIIWI